MSLPWYKRWTITARHPLFHSVSAAAIALFYLSDDLAHECGQGGDLMRLGAPLTLEVMAKELPLESAVVYGAATELLAVGLWEQAADGVITVPPIELVETHIQQPERAAEEVADPAKPKKATSPKDVAPTRNAARMRAVRARQKTERLALKTANTGAQGANEQAERVREQGLNAFANGANDHSEAVPSPHTPHQEETKENETLEDSKIGNDEPKGSSAGASDAKGDANESERVRERTANDALNDANGNGERSKRTANGKPKNTPVVPELPPDVDFGDLEADIAIFLANAAAENKTGKIMESRSLTLRRELWDVLTTLGNREAFTLGLRDTNKRGIPDSGYVKKVAISKKTELEAPPTLRLIPSRAIPAASVRPHSPDIDAIPEPLDPATTDFRKLFAGMKKATT